MSRDYAPIPDLFRREPEAASPSRGRHHNSQAAYREHDTCGREREVLEALRGIGRAATDRELMQALGYTDMNTTRPSVTRLVQAGTLREVGDITCPHTNRKVRRVFFAEDTP